jgi:hypothetical protein
MQDFFLKNWNDVKKVWYGGPAADTLHYLNHDETWSCFFVPLLMFDVYGGRNAEDRECGTSSIDVSCIEMFLEIFKPGLKK